MLNVKRIWRECSKQKLINYLTKPGKKVDQIFFFVYSLIFFFLRFILEKCEGTLVIENKKKKAMIDELVKAGFDSDPVKTWKIQIDREAALVS